MVESYQYCGMADSVRGGAADKSLKYCEYKSLDHLLSRFVYC